MNNLKECECGLTYVVDVPDEESAHDQWHQDYLNGPDIPEVLLLRYIASKDSRHLVLADKSDKESIRIKVAKVAMVAQRSMPDYKAGYYGADSEEDFRLYALIEGTRIIGMVISSIDEEFWRMSWISEGEFRKNDANAIFRSGPKIARVWIAASYRRRGLAKWLIEEVGKHMGCTVQNIGWEMPFTNDGKTLVKSVCPEQFLGCGDVNSQCCNLE